VLVVGGQRLREFVSLTLKFDLVDARTVIDDDLLGDL
jgi:hypothetical protein